MTTKRLWVPALTASMVTLLVALLVLPLQAGAQTRATTVRYSTLAPAAFDPQDNTTPFANGGDTLYLQEPATGGNFMAPLFFEDSRVRMTNLVLYAYDNGPADVCLTMYRITPENGGSTEDNMGHVCSTDATGGTRAFSISSWNYPYVYGAHGAYLWLNLPGTGDYGFMGAKVTYSFTP